MESPSDTAPTGRKVGYARVSTNDPTPAAAAGH
jgi:hypothetical protein